MVSYRIHMPLFTNAEDRLDWLNNRTAELQAFMDSFQARAIEMNPRCKANWVKECKDRKLKENIIACRQELNRIYALRRKAENDINGIAPKRYSYKDRPKVQEPYPNAVASIVRLDNGTPVLIGPVVGTVDDPRPRLAKLHNKTVKKLVEDGHISPTSIWARAINKDLSVRGDAA